MYISHLLFLLTRLGQGMLQMQKLPVIRQDSQNKNHSYYANLRIKLVCFKQHQQTVDIYVKSAGWIGLVFPLDNEIRDSCHIPLLRWARSWWRSLSYRNQSIDLLCKSMDWFLYDRNLRLERVSEFKWIRQLLFPWNYHYTTGFLTISGGIEVNQSHLNSLKFT